MGGLVLVSGRRIVSSIWCHGVRDANPFQARTRRTRAQGPLHRVRWHRRRAWPRSRACVGRSWREHGHALYVHGGEVSCSILCVGARMFNVRHSSSPIHHNIKETIVKSKEQDTVHIFRTLHNTARVYKNKVGVCRCCRLFFGIASPFSLICHRLRPSTSPSHGSIDYRSC